MLPQIMEDFLKSLAKEKLSERTIRVYRINLEDFVRGMFDNQEPSLERYQELTNEDFMNWIDKRRQEVSTSGLNQRIATLRKFYTFLMGRKIVTLNTPQTLGNIKADEIIVRPILTEQEALRLLDKGKAIAEAKDNYESYRNEMIINIFLGTGIRVEELSKISLEDINLNTGEIKIVGKRNKRRTVVLPEKVLALCKTYLEKRNKQKNSYDDSFFLSRQKSEDGSYRLSTEQIKRIVVSLSKQADVKKITPHSLRHTSATISIQNGANLMDVSKNLGHSTIAITEKIYIHQTNESARRVASSLGGLF